MESLDNNIGLNCRKVEGDQNIGLGGGGGPLFIHDKSGDEAKFVHNTL